MRRPGMKLIEILAKVGIKENDDDGNGDYDDNSDDNGDNNGDGDDNDTD